LALLNRLKSQMQPTTSTITKTIAAIFAVSLAPSSGGPPEPGPDVVPLASLGSAMIFSVPETAALDPTRLIDKTSGPAQRGRGWLARICTAMTALFE
jgi:hypothetical protein